MTSAKKPKTSKNRYAVMIPRTQVYCFEVEAKSAEDACKALWRKLRLYNEPAPPTDAALVTSSWNEAQKHDEWIIAGGALPEVAETSKSASAWNGKEIVRIRLA